MKDERDYLQSLKKKKHYHFSIPFDYIKKNHGNGVWDMATAKMEVDVRWDEAQLGYVITYYCPKQHKISLAEGNGDMAEMYHLNGPEDIVLDKLSRMGITSEALVEGTGNAGALGFFARRAKR